ncbi:hypothetical protein FSARC_13356 [Fusarium sarcochroum]|uniref:Uncharacterized protein n=1 Tax=Fusarium sarcochroum TaxID=1208366 RepID=A0A8H4T284_9HYPO|nr:hypothetical protein FSARC_13356 [Fusarium sarcochroum]
MSISNADERSPHVEARGRLEVQLNGMVKSGQITLPPGLHFRLDHNGVPTVAPMPLPNVSSMRLSQIKDYISKNLQRKSAYWKKVNTRIELSGNQISHAHLWHTIESVHKVILDDYKWIMLLCISLEAHPGRFDEFPIPSTLAPVIGRFVGTCIRSDQGGLTPEAGTVELLKLKHEHFALYILVSQVCRLHAVADYVSNPLQTVQDGKKAAQCLRALVKLISSSYPGHDLDVEIFFSLKQRVDEVAGGNRERSISPESECHSGGSDSD